MTEAAPSARSGDLAPGLERAFEMEVVEGSWDLEPEGEIPTWLSGVYFLNGPSDFAVVGAGTESPATYGYRHWLDGDGAVSKLKFDAGRVHFTHRFVDSAKRREEKEAGSLLYRAFGTSFPGDLLKRGIGIESPVNVSAYLFGDDLLAFGEQGLPFALDPTTLETKGEYTFGGRLNAISPLSAHPGFSASGEDMFNFGISFSARQPSLTFYRFHVDGELIFRRRHPLPYPCSTHDFVLSERYAIFYLSPHLLDVGSMMKGGKSVMEALTWRPELGAHLLILDREEGSKKAEIQLGGGAAGSGYCLHLINAFEAGDRLHVDLIELERPVYDQYQPLPDLFVDAPASSPRRLEINVEGADLISQSTLPYELCSDFPAIDPRYAQRDYDDFWLLGISATGRPGRKFFDQLVHLSWREGEGEPDRWMAPAGSYLGGEPVFLGDSSENAVSKKRGCVLCQLFDAEKRRSAFLLFDAYEVAKGPLARLPLRHPMPLGFHAVYYPD